MRLLRFVLFLAAISAVHGMPLCDYFIASESEAQSLKPSDDPSERFPTADLKGIDTVKLTSLGEIIARRSGKSRKLELPMIAALSEEGPWLVRVDSVLVSELADLEDPAVQSIGAEWSLAEEFKRDQWKASDVSNALSDLVRLAREARKAGRPIIVRIAM